MKTRYQKMAGISLTMASLVFAAPVAAQIDAGQVLRELTPEMLATQPLPAGPGIDVVQPALEAPEPGGPRAEISQIIFNGNSVFSDSELAAVIQESMAEPQDLAGLRNMVNMITRHYRDHGYLFARAILPPQTLDDGSLLIEVVEGRYGQVSTSGHPDLHVQAKRFLVPLQSGSVISNALLERSTLLLSDQPGIETVPVIRPGQYAGTGDLDVEVRRAERFSAGVSLDNQGNRYTGRSRIRLDMNAYSSFQFGDELSALVLYTDQDLAFGSIQYGLPIGGSGLRGFAGIRYTDYTLGKDFSALGISGRAQVFEAGASYPLLRSRQKNLRLQASFEYRDLNDRQQGVGGNTKSMMTIPVSVLFDATDSVGGWGVTYGGLTLSLGRLKLDSQLKAQDIANAHGSYQKVSWDVSRLQNLADSFSLMARISGQYAWSNLDSYEGISLGGPHGIRAYPVGEASGDRGILAQIELRYRYGNALPFVFYDHGSVTINADDFDNQPNSRRLGGAGVGVRYDLDQLQLGFTAAWRTQGGKPQSSSSHSNPALWGTVSFRF